MMLNLRREKKPSRANRHLIITAPAPYNGWLKLPDPLGKHGIMLAEGGQTLHGFRRRDNLPRGIQILNGEFHCYCAASSAISLAIRAECFGATWLYVSRISLPPSRWPCHSAMTFTSTPRSMALVMNSRRNDRWV